MVQSLDDARRRPPAAGPGSARAFAGAPGVGRIPPHNLEAEESLLGAMMLSREAITAAVEAHIESGDYYKPAHGVIYDAALSLHARGEPIDPVSVAEELRR
ncbi:MAG TPA: DnaB-like helicase N-terminal domain-containing protein, partial [Acidimicrobiia bacterium]|nr:DnaB-like helicase N-terminal domain-containing protein [Acidimicrobiia bacterium]